MSLDSDIKVALEFIKSKGIIRKENNYKTVYNITNEDLDLYFKYFPIQGGNVLSVLDSGDYVLQAGFCGAKSVFAFDNNPLALHMAKLKITSLRVLEYQEFLNFCYNDDHKGYFDISYYKKVREYLDRDVMMFWDILYSNFKAHDIFQNLLNNGLVYKNMGKYGFLNGDNYYLTKDNLNNMDIKYYCSDIFDVLSKLPVDTKFNSVFLSHIFNNMELKDAVKYPLFIKRDLDKYLYKDAMVAVHSSFHGITSDVLNIVFEDVIEYDKDNKVIVYKKR